MQYLPCYISHQHGVLCFLPLTQAEEEMCAAGVPGILANSVCCPSSCGSCGGAWVKMTHPFHSPNNNISDFQHGVGRRSSRAAPGKPLSRFHDISAPQIEDLTEPSRVSLAGVGCSGRDGGDGFTGKEACCGGGVKELGRICSSSIGAPCIISDGRRSRSRIDPKTNMNR